MFSYYELHCYYIPYIHYLTFVSCVCNHISGFARNVNWTVKSMDDTAVVLELAPSDYTKEMWDKEFLCTFTITLEADQLKTSMVVDNKGEEAFDFQAALHSYFTVSALDNLEISGSFEGKEFLNKMAGDGGEMQTEDRSAITIGEEYDRVYSGVNDPVLNDKGLERAWPFSTLLDGKTLLYGIHMEMRAWGIITSSALKVSSSIPSLLLAVNPGPETWLSSPRTFSCFIRSRTLSAS